jgi:hypothetical protein
MDDLQRPKELTDLWLDPHPPEENIDMIVEQVLREAQKFQEGHRAFDVAAASVVVVLLPFAFLVVAEAAPILLPGIAATALVMGGCLFNTRRFYRSVGRAPTPNRTTQEHLAWSLTFLEHRERLYRSNGRWGNILFPGAAIMLTVGLARSDAFSRTECLGMAGLLALAWWAGNAMTKYALRQFSEESGRMRKLREDLAG